MAQFVVKSISSVDIFPTKYKHKHKNKTFYFSLGSCPGYNICIQEGRVI